MVSVKVEELKKVRYTWSGGESKMADRMVERSLRSCTTVEGRGELAASRGSWKGWTEEWSAAWNNFWKKVRDKWYDGIRGYYCTTALQLLTWNRKNRHKKESWWGLRPIHITLHRPANFLLTNLVLLFGLHQFWVLGESELKFSACRMF